MIWNVIVPGNRPPELMKQFTLYFHTAGPRRVSTDVSSFLSSGCIFKLVKLCYWDCCVCFAWLFLAPLDVNIELKIFKIMLRWSVSVALNWLLARRPLPNQIHLTVVLPSIYHHRTVHCSTVVASDSNIINESIRPTPWPIQSSGKNNTTSSLVFLSRNRKTTLTRESMDGSLWWTRPWSSLVLL